MKMKDHDFKADIEPDRSALPQKRLTFLITIERPIGSLTMFVISCISFSVVCCFANALLLGKARFRHQDELSGTG
jgi:hypothetical protein